MSIKYLQESSFVTAGAVPAPTAVWSGAGQPASFTLRVTNQGGYPVSAYLASAEDDVAAVAPDVVQPGQTALLTVTDSTPLIVLSADADCRVRLTPGVPNEVVIASPAAGTPFVPE